MSLYEFAAGTAPDSYTVALVSTTTGDAERPPGGDWQGLHLRTTTIEARDGFLNPTRVRVTVPGSETVTDLTYDNDTTNWFIGRVQAQTATDCVRPSNECQMRSSRFAYRATTGDLERVLVEPAIPGLRLRTTYAYDDHGNVTAVASADSVGPACAVDSSCPAGNVCVEGLCGQERRVSYEYDTAGLYNTKVTNALGHTAEVDIDPSFGVPLASRDANGVSTTRTYDKLGRLREVNFADGYFERHINEGLLTQVTIIPDGEGGTIEHGRVVMDRLGRAIEHRSVAFDGTISAVSTTYDRLGRVIRRSQPHVADTAPTALTTYTYDLRGRPRTTVAPDGATVGIEYRGRETHTTDARGATRYVVERGDGTIASSHEVDPASSAWLTTTFEYRPFGHIGTVTAPDNTVQTMKYDQRGHRFEHVDPSTGTTRTTHNAFGEVVSEINGANETVSFGYDVLGRITQVTSGPRITTFTYDPPNQRGKLASAQSPDSVVTAYGYDDLGRTATTTWTIEGVPYQLAFDYDGIGRPNTVRYPAFPGVAAGLEVTYKYKTTGYLEEVENAGGAVLWRVDGRDIAGRPTHETFGSGAAAVTSARTYLPATGLLHTLRVDGPAGPLDHLEYEYDLTRNVKLRKDTVGASAKTQSYTYDTLNRLETWTFRDATASVTGTFGYNRAGSLLSETYAGRPGLDVTYQYGQAGAPKHALTARAGQAYTYDGAGRQTTAPGRSVTYNHHNLPRTVTSNGQTTTFGYDASGARVWKRDAAGQVTITLAGLFERTAGSDARNHHYVMADGRAVARITRTQSNPTGPVTGSSSVSLHRDGQRSVVLTTSNATGAVVDELFYDPFGRRTDRNHAPLPPASRTVRRGYTGHDHDDELDLINMGGRVYDPLARSFLSPDPILNPRRSQGLNRYSYARNNPATLVDPTGLSPDCIPEVGCSGGGDPGGGDNTGNPPDPGDVPNPWGNDCWATNSCDRTGSGSSDDGETRTPRGPDIVMSGQEQHQRYLDTHTFTIPCNGPVPCWAGAGGTMVLGGPLPQMPDEGVWRGIVDTSPIWVPIAAGLIVGAFNPVLGRGVTMFLTAMQAGSEGEAWMAVIGGRVGAGRASTRSPTKWFGSARVMTPPRPGQIRWGSPHPKTGAHLIEGHGRRVQGTVTIPRGTRLIVPNDEWTKLAEPNGKYVAERGMFPPQRFTFYESGDQAPRLVLSRNDGFRALRTSTTVTTPTVLDDLLREDMGDVIWVACTKC